MGVLLRLHPPSGSALRLGVYDAGVLELRAQLTQLGLLCASAQGSHAPELFDAALDHAVRLFQQRRGLRVDGVVDEETAQALEEARWRLGDRVLSYAVRHPFVGDDVAALQHRLLDMGFDCGRADGVFGPHTETALKDFQRNVGLPPDGTCGSATFLALRQLARTVVGGKANELREYERLHHAGPTLAGKLVVVDPGHGGADRGQRIDAAALAEAATEPNDFNDEAAIVDDIANRVEGRLATAGAQAFRTRASEGQLEQTELAPAEIERARFANAAEADLLISLHVVAAQSPSCQGVSSYYYGTSTERSIVGARLAELVQEEIVTRTDLVDCRAHPKTWELLRTTRMPAVRIELGYVSNASDASRLASAEFRDVVAEAIVAAVQRLYVPSQLPAIAIELDRAIVLV